MQHPKLHRSLPSSIQLRRCVADNRLPGRVHPGQPFPEQWRGSLFGRQATVALKVAEQKGGYPGIHNAVYPDLAVTQRLHNRRELVQMGFRRRVKGHRQMDIGHTQFSNDLPFIGYGFLMVRHRQVDHVLVAVGCNLPELVFRRLARGTDGGRELELVEDCHKRVPKIVTVIALRVTSACSNYSVSIQL